MKKNILISAILLTAVLMTSCGKNPLLSYFPEATGGSGGSGGGGGSNIYSEDFESYNIGNFTGGTNGWIVNMGSNLAEIVNFGSSGKALKITTNSGSSTIYANLPSSVSEATLEYDYYNSTNVELPALATDNVSDVPSNLFFFHNNQLMLNSNVIYSGLANTWYKIKIYSNMSNKIYRIYVDNVMVNTGLLSTGETTLNTLSISYNFFPGFYYLDNIKVY